MQLKHFIRLSVCLQRAAQSEEFACNACSNTLALKRCNKRARPPRPCLFLYTYFTLAHCITRRGKVGMGSTPTQPEPGPSSLATLWCNYGRNGVHKMLLKLPCEQGCGRVALDSIVCHAAVKKKKTNLNLRKPAAGCAGPGRTI